MKLFSTLAVIGIGLLTAGGLGAQETEGAQSFAEPGAAQVVKHSPDQAWLVEGARAAQQRLAEAPRHQGLWRASVAALVASSAIDAQSSWGKREANPLLAGPDGRFGTRAVAIKALITGGALGMQWYTLRHKPSFVKYAIIGNFGLAGVYARVAAHNYGNSR